MKKDEAEPRRYRVENDAEDEVWPAGIVIDGAQVAQFSSVYLARVVCNSLNNDYFPTRRQRIGRALATGGLSLLDETAQAPHEVDMPGGA